MNSIDGFLGWLLLVFLLAFCTCLVLVLTKKWHGKLSMDADSGVQKFHVAPTPRVGGLAVYLSLLAVALILGGGSSDDQFLLKFVMAGIPAFLFGFIEDLTKSVGVKLRLLATMMSGLLACYLFDVSLTKVDVVGLDYLLSFSVFSVVFTMVAIGGFANALNIVDGFNGLASGLFMISCTALGVMAYLSGDEQLVMVCLLSIGAVLGFFVVNFPMGKIFLGDGGAYFLGFLLGWIAVMLPARNPGISVWAVFLACSFPVLEVLFSIYRRMKRALSPSEPDRLHLHSLIQSRLSRKRFSHWSAVYQNSVVSPFIWAFVLVPTALSVVFRTDTMILFVIFVCFVLAYKVYYNRFSRFGWKNTMKKPK